jgi:hypothetical protein
MGWRVARSLDVLLGQLNALAPNRSKVSDGSIGDLSHQNRDSDHNPWYGPGIVTARDFTHDPGRLDCHSVAERLVANRDPRIKYLIWNRYIWSPAGGWRRYTGTNPHTSHLHLSVVASPLCDDTRLWAGFIPVKPPEPEPPKESEMRDLIIGKNTNGPDIWVGNGLTRRHVEDEDELKGLRFWITERGGDATVYDFEDLRVLGVVLPGGGLPEPSPALAEMNERVSDGTES